ncbi:dihydrofolate reductase [Nocardioides anomalus]|uniref:Dihydrofolate reductase n=1 Tax=Nocardioides anomalus TaxID=2712223 RepID=A0A6G6W8P9_9ACTN|nr:dihydrofolate reductase family protein [Nocardioides anomalus]QIG41592.1 dihydrofolate reductase [Nocardioides anomalus]
MSLLVVEHLSLDGVLQGPARTDEDPSGGFRHGGWAMAAADDPEPGAAMGRAMRPGFAWLFGRRSYDDVLTHWNGAGGPFRDGLNRTTKYVVTSDPHLAWPHSVQVAGDVAAEVARLRETEDLVVMGSGQLVRTLLEHGLVDELLLFVHPVVLGSGRRLFGDAPDAHRLRLVEATSTASGVLVATYRPD